MTAAGDDPVDDDLMPVVVGFDRMGNELVRWVPRDAAADWDRRLWGRLR